jgi:hypothetical protein
MRDPMRRLALLAALAVAALALPGVSPATPSSPALRVTEILADPDTTAGQREFIELQNAGNASVELLGWKVRDNPTASGATNTFAFPAWRLAPGERVVVWGGGAADGRGPAWSNGAVWNNAGDGASLVDPSGAVVAWVGYGATAPPAGLDGPVGPKPDKGRSVTFDGTPAAGDPSPGLATGASGALVELTVANVAPTLSFAGLPASARPGSSVAVGLAAADPNGLGDLASWSIALNGVQVAGENGAPPLTAPIAIPADAAAALLTARVTDLAGAFANATATLPLRWSDLSLTFPDGPLMGDLRPGALAVAQAPIVVRNDGAVARRPVLDVGDLRGPGQASLAGRLEVGVQDGNTTTWVPYAGPLTTLQPLPPGAQQLLWLRLRVPEGLPAGRYGASLAVAG